jgi:hypothetical protein
MWSQSIHIQAHQTKLLPTIFIIDSFDLILKTPISSQAQTKKKA